MHLTNTQVESRQPSTWPGTHAAYQRAGFGNRIRQRRRHSILMFACLMILAHFTVSA